MQHFLLPRSHSLFDSIVLSILHKLFDKVDGFCIMQLSQSNSKVFWVVHWKALCLLLWNCTTPTPQHISQITIIYLMNNNIFFLPLNFSFPVTDDVLHNCRTHHYFFRKSIILSSFLYYNDHCWKVTQNMLFLSLPQDLIWSEMNIST